MKTDLKERIQIRKEPENPADKLIKKEIRKKPENPADKLIKKEIEQER